MQPAASASRPGPHTEDPKLIGLGKLEYGNGEPPTLTEDPVLNMEILARFTPWTLALLRIMAAFLFWQHGLQKLFGLLEGQVVQFPELLWFAGVLEFLGPLFLGLGLFTRPVSFLLSGQMAAAYFIAHFPRGFWPILNDGERAVLFCFIFLFLATAGPGRLAVDNLLFRKSNRDS